MLAKYRRFCRPDKQQNMHNDILGDLQPRCYNNKCYLFVVILLKWAGLASGGKYGLEVMPDSINLAEEDTIYLRCSCTSVSNVNNYFLAWNFEDISTVEGGTIPREWQVFDGGYQSGEYNLGIPYVTVADAGIYVCTLLDDSLNVLDSASVTVSVTPIVVSDFPTCLLSRTGALSVNMELDVVCVFKQVSLAGEQVELKRKTSTGLETLAVSSPTYTLSEFTINVKTRLYLGREHNEAEFICLVSEGNLEHLTSCSFQPLKVSFRPYIVLEPILVVIDQDDSELLRFTCSVIDASPVEVTVTWFLGDDEIGPYSDRVSERKISNVSYELIIYRIISTDNGANVVCEIENDVGISIATGKIKFAVEEVNASEESSTIEEFLHTSTSVSYYLIIIIGCVALGCILLFILCNVYFKRLRERREEKIYSAGTPRQQVFTVDRPYSQRHSSGTSRSSGSGYITRAIRGELRETPSSTPKHRSSSVSTHHLTDSGHSSLMPSPEILANSRPTSSSTKVHSRSATPQGITSQQSQCSMHAGRNPQHSHGHRKHKHYHRNTHAENTRTHALPPNQRHHRRDRIPMKTNKTIPANSVSAQQNLYRKRKTRGERDRIRSKTTGEPVRATYADLDFSQSNKVRRTPRNRTDTDGRERTAQSQPIARETSANAQQPPISTSSTIVYAEINQCSPRTEEPLILTEDHEAHGIDHVIQVDEN